MKVLLNKDNKLVFVQGETKCKLIEILSKYRNQDVKLTNLVWELYNSYDDSKRVYVLRLVDSLFDDGIIIKKKISGDVYVTPVFKEANVLYYTPLIVLYFPALTICILVFSLYYQSYLAVYFATIFAIFTNFLLIIVYLIERYLLFTEAPVNLFDKLKRFTKRN
jgi:hypothetical protein